MIYPKSVMHFWGMILDVVLDNIKWVPLIEEDDPISTTPEAVVQTVLNLKAKKNGEYNDSFSEKETV
jgi:hypothetical protein